MVIAPHLSRSGPNGLWILSRGVNHPLERAFSETRIYYLKYQEAPEVIEEIDDWRSAYSLELFQSREQAEECAREEKTEFEIELDVAIAVGSDLLKLIADVDIIDIGAVRLPISEEGKRFCNVSQVANVEAVLALFNSH